MPNRGGAICRPASPGYGPWLSCPPRATPTPGSAHTATITVARQVPRMRMLIAGTGIHNIVFEWFKFVETRARALDMEMLNAHASDELRQAWARNTLKQA